MSLEVIAIAVAVAAALAAYLPFAIGTVKRVRDIASWRTGVDDALESLAEARLAGDKELGRRLDRIEALLDKRDGHIRDMSRSLQGLAELAGRAIGRTDKDT